MHPWLEENLVCPRDHLNLELKTDALICKKGHSYPYIDDIPIMLLEEAKLIHSSLRKNIGQLLSQVTQDYLLSKNGIDPYVQEAIASTCGLMYKGLINKIRGYPIPDLQLPKMQGMRFLDIGCNWGRWCISAARKGCKCIGIDPALDAIKAARRIARQMELPNIYLVADARYLPFRPESFDIVFSYSVLQHFDKEQAKLSLDEIGRILKNKGVSLIQMPNCFGIRNLYHQARRGFKEPQALSFDVRYWLPQEMKRVFSDSIGRTSLSIDGFFSLNAQKNNSEFLPLRYRILVNCSGMLKKASEYIPFLVYLADSIYIDSIKEKI